MGHLCPSRYYEFAVYEPPSPWGKPISRVCGIWELVSCEPTVREFEGDRNVLSD